MARAKEIHSLGSLISPDVDRLALFQKGESAVGNGQFWLITFLKFRHGHGGAEEFGKFVEEVGPVMRAYGVKPVLKCNTVRTVIDGNGAMPLWDAVLIDEYPSASALVDCRRSSEYAKAHHHYEAAVEQSVMIAVKGKWNRSASANHATPAFRRRPDYSKVAPKVDKTPEQMKAISPDPEQFMQYIGDERFEDGPIWMLNLLAFEPGEGKEIYGEYGARAQEKIEGMSNAKTGEKKGGGITTASEQCFALNGQAYDTFAIMEYPSRLNFLQFASGGTAKSDQTSDDKFQFRSAGLAVQILVCLKPDGIVYDSDGPVEFQSHVASKL